MTSKTEQVEADETGAGVRGRWPVTAVFFLNGILLCSYLVRIRR